MSSNASIAQRPPSPVGIESFCSIDKDLCPKPRSQCSTRTIPDLEREQSPKSSTAPKYRREPYSVRVVGDPSHHTSNVLPHTVDGVLFYDCLKLPMCADLFSCYSEQVWNGVPESRSGTHGQQLRRKLNGTEGDFAFYTHDEMFSLSSEWLREVSPPHRVGIFCGQITVLKDATNHQATRNILALIAATAGVIIYDPKVVVQDNAKHAGSAKKAGFAMFFVSGEAAADKILALNRNTFQCDDHGVWVASTPRGVQVLAHHYSSHAPQTVGVASSPVTLEVKKNSIQRNQEKQHKYSEYN